MDPPEALYIHFPFCRRKCPYCDFYSVDDRPDEIGAYVDAVIAELHHVRAEVGALRLRTIYLGGGTPTLLTPDQIGRLIHVLMIDICFCDFSG